MNIRYLAKRLAYMVLSVFGVLTMIFAMTNVLPGSAAEMILGNTATQQSVAELKHQLGLHQPLYVRYFDWLTGLVTGNWGESFVSGTSVASMALPRFVNSLYLTIVTMIIVTTTAIPLGVFAASKKNEWPDSVISLLSYAGVSIPSFVSASLLLLLLAGPPLNLFPSGGYVPISDGIFAWLSHLILPALSLTILIHAHVMRQARSSMVDALQADYVRTARLKGMPKKRVVFLHALRNGLLPTITVIALNFGWLMGSIVIVEEIFAYPGLGRMIVNAISSRDIPVIQIGILLASVSYIVANFFADILYTHLDPRINLSD